ncbi:surface protein sp1 protein [Apiospora saccharicola]|uniref:Surface protein sp1 protein n=1 Tax=Apiospora saccharicola TaxID=335842 RepID=A0ABR1VCK6_9PEZI
MHFTSAIATAILAYCAVAAPAGPTCDRSESVCRSYTANNGLSSAECTIATAQCIGSCQVTFNSCSIAPDANHADCVSRLVGCTGKSVQESLQPQSAVAKRFQTHADSCSFKDDACRTAPDANMAQCSAEKAECKDQCSADADACRTAPGANMAQCASGYAKCLGYNPYSKRAEEPHWETGDAVTFPAEAKKVTSSLFQKPTSSSGSPVRSGSCVLADNKCRTAPDANMAQCSAEQAACKSTCQADSNACRTAPGANQSTCSAEYASCLGENPYAKKRGAPTSSTGSAVHVGSCVLAEDSCRNAPDANMSLCSAEKASCRSMCAGEASACRVAPGANQAQCSAEYASCLGENPYAKRDAPTSSTGSAVHQGSCKLADDSCRTAPDANMSFCSAEQAACKDMCSSENTACRVVPGANMSTCSAEYASCLGENPYAKRDAPTSSTGSAVHQGNCKAADDSCRTAPGANMAQCSGDNAKCEAMCSTDNDACRGVPGANMAVCSGEYASCLGYNPYTN